MSQHPYGYGGYPPQGYQQYYQQQQQQMPQSQQQQPQQRSWPQQQQQQQQQHQQHYVQHPQQQQQQQLYNHHQHHQQRQQQQQQHPSSSREKDLRPYIASNGGLPPGVTVVGHNSQFTMPELPKGVSISRQSLGNEKVVQTGVVPPPLHAKPSVPPSFPTSTQEEEEVTKPRQYKPLVKHFNRNELGFDLSRVKTEPGLLGGPPPLTIRPELRPSPSMNQSKPNNNSVMTSSNSKLNSSPVVSTSSKTQIVTSIQNSMPSNAVASTGNPKSHEESIVPLSNKSSDADSGVDEENSLKSIEDETKKDKIDMDNNADSTGNLDTFSDGVQNEDELNNKNNKGIQGSRNEEEHDILVSHVFSEEDAMLNGLPDTASESVRQSIDFFSNLKNPVVGKDTLCIYCTQNCYDKDPKLLNCLHTICSSCLKNQLKESSSSKSTQDVILDLDVAPIGIERSVYCPPCKIKTLENEITQNIIIISADLSMGSEDSDGKICNSCDEDNISSQWCKDCEEYLCDDCVKAHLRVKMTKDHILKLVISSKKQLSSSSSSVPSLQSLRICSYHEQEYLDYYCDNCEKLTCRTCQLLNHQGHTHRLSRDVVIDFKLKLRQMVSDVKLKKNTLEENRALLGTKLTEVNIKERSLLTQLKDIEQYLVNKIECRFKELIKGVSKTILDKRKALDSRKSTLDRIFQQADHSLAFVDHLINFKSQEQYGEDLSILSAKRTVERQLRRLKKTDTSTGLTDQTNNFKLDAYFQQYSGSAMHEGLDSCLKQMLADVKVLNAPPKAPPSETVAPQPNVQLVPSPSQKIVIKRPVESPSQGSRPTQRTSLLKSQTPQIVKRSSSTSKAVGRGLSSPNIGGRGSQTSSGRGRSPAVKSSGSGRGGRGGSASAGPGRGASTRGVKNGSVPTGRGGVARGGMNHSLRGKSMGPAQVGLNKTKQGGNTIVARPSVGIGRGSSSLNNSSVLKSPSMAINAQQKMSLHQKQLMQQQQRQQQQRNAQQLDTRRVSHRQQVLKQNEVIPSKPPILRQRSQITVTSSNYQQQWPNNANNWTQQQQQQQQNNYFVAAYGQQQQQEPYPPSGQVSTTLQSATQPSRSSSSWHTPQIDIASSVASQANTVSKSSDTSFKITLPSISKIQPNTNSIPHLEISNSNQESFSAVVESKHSLEIDSQRLLPSESVQQGEKEVSESISKPQNSNLNVSHNSTIGKVIESVSTPKGITVTIKKEVEDNNSNPTNIPVTTHNSDAEDWCAVCHDGGDVQYCCARCPKVYHLYCYIPPITSEPPDDWVCIMCATVAEIYQYSNKVEKGKMGERDLMICRRLLFELYNQYPQSASFKDCADLNFPEYLEVVKDPIALDVIKNRVDPNNIDQYSRIEEFLSDVRRMFKNCYIFHEKDSQWFTHAKELEEYLDKKLEEWIPHLAYDQTLNDLNNIKKRRNTEPPTPGPSSTKKKKKLDVPAEESSNPEDIPKKKSKDIKIKRKSKVSDDKDNGEDKNEAEEEEDGEESESLSEGEKLDYLDCLEAKLDKAHKTVDEKDGEGSNAVVRRRGRSRYSLKKL